MAHGIKYLSITTDPVELWAASNSKSRIEKEFFDSKFEPFYRVQQIILSPKNLTNFIHNTSDGPIEFGPAFDPKFLKNVFELLTKLKELRSSDEVTGLKDICFAPLASSMTERTVDSCAIQSLWGWFQDDEDTFDFTEDDSNGFETNYLDHLLKCFKNPYNFDCLANYGGPVDPSVALGGYPLQESRDTAPHYEKATATIITILVNNQFNKSLLEPALSWEAVFVDFMKTYSSQNGSMTIDVSYKAERSIEDEINRESQSDVLTILVSYIIMFTYIAVSLGQVNNCKDFLVDSKITLGLGGVVIVLASVVASVGIFGLLGVPATLIIIEVIPFLVLAVGVDNIFIIVQTHQRIPKRPEETYAEHLGRVMEKVGPSIMLTSISESCCFFLGALSTMPAVRAFALYAGTSLLIDYCLQITCFVSLLALDTIRTLENRYDVACFIRKKNKAVKQYPEGLLYGFFKTFYIPFLMKKPVRAGVMVIFFGWLCLSISVAPHIEIGLDQELSMPEDSFVLKYFQSMKKYLRIGPPVYFVVKGNLNYSKFETQNLLCGGQYCNTDSLSTQIYIASKQMANETYIARTASSWLDDYFDWSAISGCCKYFPRNQSFCPHSNGNCLKCHITSTSKGRPDPLDFDKYLPYFLEDNPDAECVKGGHAAYKNAVYLKKLNGTYLHESASYFMTYHSVLNTSFDYYESMRAARKIADNITRTIHASLRLQDVDEATLSEIEVFPYSVFYVYYEQYLTMWSDTLQNMGISVLAIFFVTLVLQGFDINSSIVVVTTITMIVINIGGR